MARINDNLLVRGARGRMGKQFMYKRHGEDTFITRMPAINKDLQPTDRQMEIRDLFAEAALYAQGAISDPELKKEYRKKAKPGRTAYNIAFRDFLKAPVVKSIETDSYTGVPASPIVIRAKDDFRVAEVKVRILTAAGVLVEEGNAVLNPIKRNKWIYTATQNNAALAGTKIQVTALDLPGNTGVLQAVFPGAPAQPL
jgi:hypothetical protein